MSIAPLGDLGNRHVVLSCYTMTFTPLLYLLEDVETTTGHVIQYVRFAVSRDAIKLLDYTHSEIEGTGRFSPVLVSLLNFSKFSVLASLRLSLIFAPHPSISK